MRARTLLLLAPLIALAIFAGPGKEALGARHERILDFRSNIEVHRDGAVTVTEIIKVVSTGREIKRGIYRDFPTTYKDRLGNTVRVGFKVVDVLRDGRPEPYRLDARTNGIRIYIGQKDVLLKRGTYTYKITYRTTRQIGFFENSDEIYWNVTGNGWEFAIERASASVVLPEGAKALDYGAYTGRQGARGGDFIAGQDARGHMTFITTRALKRREGLTIFVAWPKGFVAPPKPQDKARYFLGDNAGVLAAIAGIIVLLVYYVFAWLRVGKDPAGGTIIPLFSPPDGFSPAAVRFVMQMEYDDKAFAAAVVNMAVKGYLTIEEGLGGDFTLRITGGDKSVLTLGERRTASKLFGRAAKIELKPANHTKISNALDALKTYLKAEFEKIHFMRNRIYIFPGIAITIVTLAGVVLSAHQVPEAAFLCLWLSIWTTACYFMVIQVMKEWQGRNWLKAGFTSLFVTPFLVGEVLALLEFGEITSPLITVLLFVLLLINAVFYDLLRAPTIMGQKIMDQIEGFKLYLSVAEKERLETLNPPDRTPELFEKYLPFALALGVENQWSEQFADVLAAAAVSGDYSPHWYSGNSWHTDGVGGLTSSLGGSFSGAISSSSTAPGSSSGGGGFSGGGGGGGGGGGW